MKETYLKHVSKTEFQILLILPGTSGKYYWKDWKCKRWLGVVWNLDNLDTWKTTDVHWLWSEDILIQVSDLRGGKQTNILFWRWKMEKDNSSGMACKLDSVPTMELWKSCWRGRGCFSKYKEETAHMDTFEDNPSHISMRRPTSRQLNWTDFKKMLGDVIEMKRDLSHLSVWTL